MISKFNNGIRSLLRVTDIFSKHEWVITLKDKKGITITKAFQEILNESSRKANKICVDKSGEFNNRSIKSWLQGNDIEIYSTHNEEKYVAAQRFFRTLKNKIYKYIISVSKKVYIDNLVDIVDKCNNTYDSKMQQYI